MSIFLCTFASEIEPMRCGDRLRPVMRPLWTLFSFISLNSFLAGYQYKLVPYIMVSPDIVERGNPGPDGRESIRFEKLISNGIVLVVEKEQKNSSNDMDTITMWAEKSSRVMNIRKNESPGNVQNVISGIDAAKRTKKIDIIIFFRQKT